MFRKLQTFGLHTTATTAGLLPLKPLGVGFRHWNHERRTWRFTEWRPGGAVWLQQRGRDGAGCQISPANRTRRMVAELGDRGYLGHVKTAVLREEQFLTDAEGKRVGVLLDLRAYERLREAEEQLADIRAYDKAQPAVRAEIAAGQFVTLAEYRVSRARKRK